MSDDFLEIFKAEATERLETIADLLLRAERGGDSDTASVHALMREAHTLKGAAGMVGMDEVAAIAHEFENVLAPVREQGGPVPPELVPTLLAAADRMREGILGPVRRQPSVPPPPRVRVPAEKVDRLLDLVGETLVQHRRSGSDEGEVLLDELKDAALQMRMQPLSSVAAPLRRAVRECAVAVGKEVDIVFTGFDTELDRAILEGLPEILVHLVRNAVDHGIERPAERAERGKPSTGTVEVRATQHGSLVEIAVADDGGGVDAALLGGGERDLAARLAEPGLSTASTVTDISGRGVGLDSVLRFAEGRGGSLAARSTPGAGTEVTLTLPFTLALVEVLLFERGANVFALPLSSVEEVLRVEGVLTLGGRAAVDLRGNAVPIADLAELLGADASSLGAPSPAVVVGSGGRRLATLCDRLIGEDEVVVKALGPPLDGVPGYLGTAVLGDGRIALVLDPAVLVRSVRSGGRLRPAASTPVTALVQTKVLVVEDSFTVRELQRSIFEAAGYAVATAEDGHRALAVLDRDADISVVISDVDMPELDGFGLAAAVRADPTHASLPIVLVTSRDRDEDRRRGLEAGADAYVVKSAFDQAALLTTVARLVGG